MEQDQEIEDSLQSPQPNSNEPLPSNEENTRSDNGTPLLDDTDFKSYECANESIENKDVDFLQNVNENSQKNIESTSEYEKEPFENLVNSDKEDNETNLKEENLNFTQDQSHSNDFLAKKIDCENNDKSENEKSNQNLNDDESQSESINIQENSFEEVDINTSEKEKDKIKSNLADEFDALKDDRTQIISETSRDSNNHSNFMDVDDSLDGNNCERLKDVEMKSGDEDEDNLRKSEGKTDFDKNTNETNSKETQDNDNDISSPLEIEEAAPNESEDVCLLPDEEKELTSLEKERAIEACQTSEESIQEVSPGVIETRVSTPVDEINLEDLDQETNENFEENNDTELNEFVIKEIFGDISEQNCYQCKEKKLGNYKVFIDKEINYLCDINCVKEFRSTNKNYTLICRRIIITTTYNIDETCHQCKEKVTCHFRFKNPKKKDENIFFCSDKCLSNFIGDNTEKYFIKGKKYIIEELVKEIESGCIKCKKEKKCKYSYKEDNSNLYICGDECLSSLNIEEADKYRKKKLTVRVRDLGGTLGKTKTMDNEPKIVARTESEAETARLDRAESFIRRCAQCFSQINCVRMINWETLDFCNEICLSKYQNRVGSRCQSCFGPVSIACLGKYCVRFGFELRQFCCSKCLDNFKKELKVCSLCQKDISKLKEGFLAHTSNKGQFKDFCSRECLKIYEELNCKTKNPVVKQCAVCNNEKCIQIRIKLDESPYYFCSKPCFSAFKFVNNIIPDQCELCLKFFERKSASSFTVYEDKTPKLFCSQICMNIYIIMNRKIATCQWCKVKKYNFDMIQKQSGSQILTMCSLNCLTLYGASINVGSTQKEVLCDQCQGNAPAQYHLTMSDATIRNFCTYQCVMSFQSQFGRTPLTLESVAEKEAGSGSPFPTSLPKRINKSSQPSKIGSVHLSAVKSGNQSDAVPVISSVESLANSKKPLSRKNKNRKPEPQTKKYCLPQSQSKSQSQPQPQPQSSQQRTKLVNCQTQTRPIARRTVGTYTTENANDFKTRIITVPPAPPKIRNMMTMCKPNTASKIISCHPNTNNVHCQTDKDLYQKVAVPIPVPIYVPMPMYMYSAPFPVPVPIPLPIPVPIFIPTTRNSAAGILKEIKKIQDKMPTNPYEADLLMMAEMVAGEKRKDESDSDSDSPLNNDDDFVTHSVEPSNSFGEDVLTMALKMATEYEEPAVDLESAMATNTITPPVQQHIQDDISAHQMIGYDGRQIIRGRKRVLPIDGNLQEVPRNDRLVIPPQKKHRREVPQHQILVQEQQVIEPIKQEPVDKPDANMCLKYTFGVNAWKQWVVTKNAELEKSSIRRRPFKVELLQMTADELNYSLCLFVKEVRKPNGSEYAPDTIYYLVLGIQQYLFENGRIDNIFTDTYYERFTDCLDEVAKKFSVLYNDSQYIVTRVEEEHLWECRQLGAHSPHVLLTTLMFFNTKHFNLTTVDEHMQLSFSHIMKHWKRSTPGIKTPGSRNVLLRFYPPQTGPEANPRKKKVYEQQENEDNPLRCPVKLYEFYLSKCPESVKTRNDVFYLQPERSCVPDSPVWYSTQPLSREALSKMLHRVKMVKEINIALLTS